MTLSKFNRLLKDYKRKSLAYNLDCNMRFLGRGKTDVKREKLKASATSAFEEMISAFKEIAK